MQSGGGSGTDDRVGCRIFIPRELKKQLARHSTGRMCSEAGGWARWLWEQASFGVLFSRICFHHNSLPPNLLLHFHSADISTNACSLASLSLTPSVGSPCSHGPSSHLLEGFSLCLIPCLDTSRSKLFGSWLASLKLFHFFSSHQNRFLCLTLQKPSRRIFYSMKVTRNYKNGLGTSMDF